ncbi:MAG TPA: peptide MFS transporter [Vicinamibacterales bacterium]|nr:peptide MFS transporter [Vicinamibacterales bacterium]
MNPPKLTDALTDVGQDTSEPLDTRFFGHPRGLATLFFTEMWERFSYYGMRAFLLFYMVTPTANGGLGFTDAQGTSLYGTYTGSAWGAAIVGGIIADRMIGQYRSVLYGGILIMLGHLSLVFQALPFFYAGLALIVIGTGLLKPSVSTLVGSLYPQGDPRRDAGFSIFYMGINSGAMLGPIIAGYIAQRIDWHLGFGCAAIGMALGLVQYVLDKRHLMPALQRMEAEKKMQAAAPVAHVDAAPGSGGALGFTSSEWNRIAAIVVLFLFASLFWAGYEAAGSSLALFADRNTDLHIFGLEFPSSWLQVLQPFFVIVLAPLFAWLWIRLGTREPSVATKFGFGLLFMGLAFVIMLPAGAAVAADNTLRVSVWWLIMWNLFSEFGELCLSPVGLSAITKLSPARIVGLMMGVWFLSLAAGNKLSGWMAGLISTMSIEGVLEWMGGTLLVAALVMFVLVKPLRRLMGDVK